MKNVIKGLLLASSLVASAAAAQSTTATKTAVKKSPWGASYSNYINGPAMKGPGSSSVNHYFNIKRKLGKGYSLTATGRMDTQFNTSADRNSQGDHYVKLSVPTLYKGDAVTVSGQVRAYVPSSQSSKDKNIDVAFSPRVYVSGSAGKADLLYILIPKFTSYSARTSEQKTYSHGHWMSVAYNLFDWMTLDFAMYPGWSYKRNGVQTFNNTPVYPGATFKVGKNGSISTYMEVIAQKATRESSSYGASLSYKVF